MDKKTCGKCGSDIVNPGPCPVCKDSPFSGMEDDVNQDFPKARGWNRAMPAERAMMEKGCTCQENGFGQGPPGGKCPYHSKPHYHSYALGEYGAVHFLIRMPSGWLVGIPEHEMHETMELTEPGAHPPYETHTLARPDETREPPDDPVKAANALHKFVPFRHCPPGQDPIHAETAYEQVVVENKLIDRYQACVLGILNMFQEDAAFGTVVDPLPDGHPAHSFIERLEALIELKLICPNKNVTIPAGPPGPGPGYESPIMQKMALCVTCKNRFDPQLQDAECPHRYRSMDAAAMDDGDLLHNQVMGVKGRLLVMEQSTIPVVEEAAGRALVQLEELEGQVKHIKDWLVSWGQENDRKTDRAWTGICDLRQDHDAAFGALAERVASIEDVLRDLGKLGGGTPVENMRLDDES